MPPRLAAISGKHKGAVFAINEDTLVIGRETSAHVSIADASVSRRHSKIEKKD
jgi:pSer/pThr/pTyr-binding forkhead associated (FHA) protein